MQAYQNTTPGSREFHLRLIELVAAAVHQIGVLLFRADNKLHTKEEIETIVSWKWDAHWVELGDRRGVWEEPLPPRPTLFYHVEYMDHDQYPDGLADVAGYWAEDRILGGVALFDRGTAGTEVSSHPHRDPLTDAKRTRS